MNAIQEVPTPVWIAFALLAAGMVVQGLAYRKLANKHGKLHESVFEIDEALVSVEDDHRSLAAVVSQQGKLVREVKECADRLCRAPVRPPVPGAPSTSPIRSAGRHALPSPYAPKVDPS
jgi:hypothetical protein